MTLKYVKREGPNLVVDLTTWDGEKRRYVKERLLVPTDQRFPFIRSHNNCIDSIKPRRSLSPSLEGFADIRKRVKVSSQSGARPT